MMDSEVSNKLSHCHRQVSDHVYVPGCTIVSVGICQDVRVIVRNHRDGGLEREHNRIDIRILGHGVLDDIDVGADLHDLFPYPETEGMVVIVEGRFGIHL
jgi:hypothetical protein